MSQLEKIILKILTGNSDSNINFDDLKKLLLKLGFELRVKGSHHIFWKNDVEEIINLQPDNGKAKAYQVKQVRQILIKYKLAEDEL